MHGQAFHHKISKYLFVFKNLIYENFSAVLFLKTVFSSKCLFPTPKLSWNVINPFLTNATFLYPLKNFRKTLVLRRFQEVRKWKTGTEWVNFDQSNLCSTRLKTFLLSLLLHTFFMRHNIGDFLELSFLTCPFLENTTQNYVPSLSFVVTNLACIPLFIISPVIFVIYTTSLSHNCLSLQKLI